jgi:hypothetical protein
MNDDERARVRAKVLEAAKLAAEAEAKKKASATPRERFFAVAVAAQHRAAEESHREGDLVDDLTGSYRLDSRLQCMPFVDAGTALHDLASGHRTRPKPHLGTLTLPARTLLALSTRDLRGVRKPGLFTDRYAEP